MAIVKIIEVIASSEKSFDDATRNALIEASKSVDNIKSIYVKEMNAKVENNCDKPSLCFPKNIDLLN